MAHLKRIVVLVDMDCFYCQVEEVLNENLKNKPIAVVQYNAWKGGGIIAVNYPARDKGVTRHMRGAEAKIICPEIELVSVPEVRGKADLTKYREAGNSVAEVLKTFSPLLQRASVDEAYLDITEAVENRLKVNNKVSFKDLLNTFVVGCELKDFIDNVNLNGEFCEANLKLAMGAVIVEELRKQVYEVTGYRCSAGIAHNKILAKLVCSLHKPNKQTVLPHDYIQDFYSNVAVKKIPGMGGKFGDIVKNKLQISNMAELSKFSEKNLRKMFDERTGKWLYNLAQGIDLEPVTVRLVSKSIGCCKNFPGRSALTDKKTVHHWLNELSTEIMERLEKDLKENNRRAKQLVVNFSQDKDVSISRSTILPAYDQTKIFQSAVDIINKNCLKSDDSYCIKFLGLSVGQFEDIRKVRSIISYFRSSNSLVKPIEEPNESSNGNEDSDSSIYSQSTLEDSDMDKDSLIYFEQINPDSIKDQTFVKEEMNESNNSTDSISQELVFNTNNSENNNNSFKPSTSSFFVRYFEQKKRTFDTSKILNNESEETDDEELMSNEDNVFKIHTCTECNKNIAYEEYQSHMDYHFALKLVRDEACLYKTNSSSTERSNNKLSPKSNSILGFIKKSCDESETDDDCEVCSECNKRVKLADFSTHLDFHAARKLHKEINSCNSGKINNTSTAVKDKTTKTKNCSKKSSKLSKVGSITSFLKPL